MTPERYERVRAVFLAARELRDGGRAAYLRDACGSDAELRREVDSLLASDAAAGTFLGTPALGTHFALPRPETRESLAAGSSAGAERGAMGHPALPARIGPYRILDVIGEGGMGIVYRAEQDHPRRTVALKIVRGGPAAGELLRRFRFEAEILARLQHPGIAQIYSAGTARTGPDGRGAEQPYFAMELIRGRPLHEHVAAARLDVRARLRLMARVCDAVQYAHQQGVIHRDLKPANILVDEQGQPKILDFGVARVTDADRAVTMLATCPGQIVGTLAYMSPEQMSGRSADVDTRTDVYSLGAILYELLAGRPPHELAGRSLPEAARIVAEDDPPAFHTLGARLDGDVQAIVAKALERDRNRRYASAAALADDLRRHLAQQPVSAQPASGWYQLRKFARRNRALVAGAAATTLALLAGVAGTTWQALAAMRERDRARMAARTADEHRAEAEQQAAIARAVNEFLNEDLLAQAKPGELGRDATIRAALDAAAARIASRFANAPRVAAAVRFVIGDTYYALGEYAAAAEHLSQALAAQRAELGDGHADTLRTMSRLGLVYLNTARFDEAEELLRAAAAGRARLFGETDTQALATLNHLALLALRRERLAEAETLLQRVLELNARAQEADSENASTARSNLASLYERQGRYVEAEPLYLRALEASRVRWGPEAPATLSVLHSLGVLYMRLGRLSEAEELLRTTLETQRRVLGEEHPRTLTTLNTLALVYKRAGQREQAEALLLQTLATKERVLGPDHPNTLNAVSNVARLYLEEGRWAEAEPLAQRLVAARRRVLGPDHPATATALGTLAEVCLRTNRLPEADQLAAEAYDRLRSARGPEHSDTQAAVALLVEISTARGDAPAAERWRAVLKNTPGDAGAPATAEP